MTEKKEILRELKEISSKVTELISKLEKEEKEKEMILEGRYEQNETIEKELESILSQLGASKKSKGYQYIIRAVLICLKDPSFLNGGVTTRLYPKIAEEFGTNPHNIDHAIQYQIQIIFQKDNLEIRKKLFQFNMRKPSNSNFIVSLAEYLSMSRHHQI